MDRRHLLLATPSLLLGRGALAQHAHAGHAAKPAACDGALGCAAATTPAFDPEGRLWLAWSAGGRVQVARADATATPTIVTPEPAAIDDNGEARPKLVVLRDGTLFAAWTVRRDRFYNGMLMAARSTDGGRSFSAPRPLLPEGTSPSQRFEHLAEGPDGRLWAFWLDKRNVARAGQKPLPGAGLAMAVSEEAGRSFTPSRIVAETTCECCRLGLAFDAAGQPALAWRHVFPGSERDHAVGRIGTDGTMQGPHRISLDAWAIEACPHHGPAFTIAGDGAWHAAWWSGGGARRGLFHARSTDAGQSFSEPVALGDPKHQPGHPQLLTTPTGLLLAWQEFDGEATRIRLQRSADGVTWGPPRGIAETRDAADRPLLTGHGARAFLSWQTAAEGWRLIPIRDGEAT